VKEDAEAHSALSNYSTVKVIKFNALSMKEGAG
jgi:hypothetical protein